MIRAIVWKELREQGLIAVMLAVLGGALLVAAAMFTDPPAPGAPATDLIASQGAGRLLTLMLVVTAGMVCGGALFAAEKEAGTISFLEAMPAARFAVWRAKLVAGLVLAAAEVSALLAVAVAFQLADGRSVAPLVVYSLLAFAWGTLGSTLARTTLGSVGIAIPAAALAMFLFLLPMMLLFSGGRTGLRAPGWVLFDLLMLVTPLALSAWRFTALDRQRAAEALERVGTNARAATERRPRSAGLGIRALAWLTLRQLRLTGLVLSAFAAAFGLALLLPELRPLFIWPPLALAAGVLTGVTVFGDEQSHRTALFWGEFRLPVGRAWWVKVSLHLVLLAWLLFLLMLPCLVRTQVQSYSRYVHGQTLLAAVFHSRLFDELGPQGWKYLLVPAAYGFAFGHLCGLLFRKLVVACGVAMMLGGVGSVAWGPSLLAGGVRHEQVWLPAGVALLTSRLVMRSWSADRAGARAALLRVGAGVGAAAVLLVFGLWYRVVQVPSAPDNGDDVAYVSSLPSYDENMGGREFRMAGERFARAMSLAQSQERLADPQRQARTDERLESAVRFGWPKGKEAAELAAWLDRLYAEQAGGPEDKPWPAMAASASERPIGVYDPPQLVNTMASTAQALDNARKMAVAVLARGLQQQAQGDPAQFVPAFRTGLALARTLRHGGGSMALEAGIEVERISLQAANHWMERLPVGHTEQTRALTRALVAADDPNPFDARPHLLADRFVVRGMMQAPSQWLTLTLAVPGVQPEQTAAEADLVSIAWAVPWERERTRRLVGLPNDSLRPDTSGYLVGRPGSPIIQGRSRAASEMSDRELFLRVLRRSVILKSAVRAYLGERGSPPIAQADLVSGGYLSQLPADPFTDGQPFGYRVSNGEELIGPARTGIQNRPVDETAVVKVSPGQVVIWSVGHDRKDQGGKVPPGGPRAEDLVFLVPEPGVLPK